MLFAFAFGIVKDIIKVYYHKNVEFLYQNLIDVALKHSQCIGQFKKHHLVLEMAIAGLENYLSFIAFLNSYLMIGIG